MVTKSHESVDHLILALPINTSDITCTAKSVIAQQSDPANRNMYFVLRVSPSPPPESFIAAWCACLHESFVMTSSFGSSSALNCCSKAPEISHETNASARYDTKVQTLSRIEASTGPTCGDAVDIALSVANPVLWRRTANIKISRDSVTRA
jgi:hypothetical protein